MDVSFAIQPGSPAKPNEDFVAAAPHAVVVLDGLSAPAELGTGCVHGTPWYVAQLGTQLLRSVTRASADRLTDVLAEAISSVADLHASSCDLPHPGTPSSSVLLLRDGADTVDYLVLFDSTIVLDTPNEPTVVSDDRVLQFAKAERERTKTFRIGTAEHAAAVRDLVAAERRHRNQPGGYWVAGAVPHAAREAITGSVEVRETTGIALMTDGVSCLVDTYWFESWSSMLDQLGHSGPASTIAQVRDIERSDPDGKRWPRYKLSDDATVAFCSWHRES